MNTHPSDAITQLHLRSGEGRWLDAGPHLRIVLQQGSLRWQAAPAFDGLPAGEGRLAAGESCLLHGWLWLQADRASDVLCLAPAPSPAAALWREAARAAGRAVRALARAAAATLQPGRRSAC